MKTHILLAAFCCAIAVSTSARALDCTPPTATSSSAWTTWFDNQEGVGKGHAQACHVSVAVSGLIHRITSPGTVTGTCGASPAASSFTDKPTAVNALKAGIAANARTAAAGPAGDTQVHLTAAGNIGTIVAPYTGKPDKNRSPCGTNKAYTCTSTKKFFAIIRKTGPNTCFLLTAYPEA